MALFEIFVDTQEYKGEMIFGRYVNKMKESGMARFFKGSWHMKFLSINMNIPELYYSETNSAEDLSLRKVAIGLSVGSSDPVYDEVRSGLRPEENGLPLKRQEVHIRVRAVQRFPCLLGRVSIYQE